MKLPAWIRRPDATTRELEQQLGAAEEQHRDALAAVERATEEFDSDPSPGAERDLATARDNERRASEHVARAERLLAAARERDAKAERARQEQRLAELEAQLARTAVRAAARPLIEREVELLVGLASVHTAKAEMVTRHRELARERARILVALGRAQFRDVAEFRDDYEITSRVSVRELLVERLRALAAGDDTREHLAAMIATLGERVHPSLGAPSAQEEAAE